MRVGVISIGCTQEQVSVHLENFGFWAGRNRNRGSRQPSTTAKVAVWARKRVLTDIAEFGVVPAAKEVLQVPLALPMTDHHHSIVARHFQAANSLEAWCLDSRQNRTLPTTPCH